MWCTRSSARAAPSTVSAAKQLRTTRPCWLFGRCEGGSGKRSQTGCDQPLNTTRCFSTPPTLSVNSFSPLAPSVCFCTGAAGAHRPPCSVICVYSTARGLPRVHLEAVAPGTTHAPFFPSQAACAGSPCLCDFRARSAAYVVVCSAARTAQQVPVQQAVVWCTRCTT